MAKSKGSGQNELEPTGVETARSELARVRARFGLDPANSPLLFAGAWTSPSGAVEEDEAEFVDALAGCLSAGFSLGAAVEFWASGALARGEDDERGNDDDGELGALTRLAGTHTWAHPDALKAGPA
jgi:hypothetical protein